MYARVEEQGMSRLPGARTDASLEPQETLAPPAARRDWTGGADMSQYEDLLIDALLDNGFTLDEALRLIALQERFDSDRHTEAGEHPPDIWRYDDTTSLWN
jgi:hypothetical protein